MTIFAWISSSFPALTFLGQKSVTKLAKGLVQRTATLIGMYSRPKVSSPSFAVLACVSLLLQYRLYALADGSQRLLENGNLVFSRHVAPRELEVFLNEKW